MINLSTYRTVGDLSSAFPQSISVLKEFGIDFCCGGNRELSQVLAEQKISEELFLKKLSDLREERDEKAAEQDFQKMSPPVLSAYIEDTHHDYLRRTLPETEELLTKVLRVHGKNHPELFSVYRLFGRLKADLGQHLIKEETMLFPLLSEKEENRTEVSGIASEILDEHEAAGEILRELRRVTGDYSLPEDACRSFQRAYSMLEEIEDDLHQHIHLENNILLREFALNFGDEPGGKTA